MDGALPEGSATARGRRPLRVLVVDPQRDCAHSTATLLHLYGHVAEVAADGLAALRRAAQAAFDVVLTELRLPGLDGYELARRLTAPRPARTPVVVAVTGFDGPAERARTAAAGFDLHLVKPVDPLALRSVLSRIRRAVAPPG